MKLLAADCGGSRIKLGLIDGRSPVAHTAIEARAGEPIEGRLDAIADRLSALCDEQEWSLADCRGILLALPVIVAPDHTQITATFGKFADAKGFDFSSWAQASLGLPVVIENDARSAAIGEWSCGAGHGVENMVMVTLGTGIGTAVICDGAPLRGRSGMAGNLGGHTATHLGAETCPCGVEGCLEAQIATWALPALAGNHPEFAGSSLAEEPVLDYETVFRHAAAADHLAESFRDRALQGWGALLVNLVHGYDPERIVIGGGIMAQADDILPSLREIVDRQATLPGGPVEIVPTALGDSAALLGAHWLFENQQTEDLEL